MLREADAFSGFSVNDIDKARHFYEDTLGLEVDDSDGMGLKLVFKNGGSVFIYEKPDHTAATFTILNFEISDIDAVVDGLSAKGVMFEHYDSMPGTQDDKQILRGKEANMGPDIAWFKDPAGNILSVLQS